MIDTLKQIITSAIVALVVTFLVMVGSNQPSNLGSTGDIEQFAVWFTKGLYGGSSKVQIVDSSGNVVAPIVGSTISGTTLTLTDLLTGVNASFSSTVATGLLTTGGDVLSTSTVSTAMIPTAATFNYGLIQITPNTADLTYTFPASSTLSAMIPNAGNSRTVMIYNATTTAGIDVIFAAGTGMEIKGTGSTPLTIDEASMGTLTFVRKANSDILVLVNPAVAD